MLAASSFLKEIITQGLAIPILKGQTLHPPNKLINSQFPTECLIFMLTLKREQNLHNKPER